MVTLHFLKGKMLSTTGTYPVLQLVAGQNIGINNLFDNTAGKIERYHSRVVLLHPNDKI